LDEDEFDEFYSASYRRVCGQVFAMIGNVDEAQECTQEAFAKAWAHRRRLDRGGQPEAWVRTVAYRMAVSRWRRVQRSRRPADRALSPRLTAEAPSVAPVAVTEALRRLPEAQRRVLVLHHLADLSVREIAAELGVPEGTVKARLSRGRAQLRTLLDDTSASGPGPDAGRKERSGDA
jgi:RNA polymerase sigma-70 factor, ECF subfamily